MAKKRVDIPGKTREQVLKVFNHRCARCGADRPQLHHIDEDPSNNDPMNLIPLCPNCHLTDQHDPTRLIEPGRLRLFRQYRNPHILTPQFHALFRRLQFLDTASLDDLRWEHEYELLSSCLELIAFVESLEMGEFYSKKLAQLILEPSQMRRFLEGYSAWSALPVYSDWAQSPTPALSLRLQKVRDQVYDLVVELLRFQDWRVKE